MATQPTIANHEKGMLGARSTTLDAKQQQLIDSLDYSNVAKELRSNIREKRVLASYEARLQQLMQIRKAFDERCDDIMEAVTKDLARHPVESFQGEVMGVVGELDHCVKHLKEWMAPQAIAHPLVLQPGSSMIVSQAKGVVLVISPWNFPTYLAFSPIIYAIAAGNAVVVKPSEMTPHSAKIIQEIVEKYMDPRIIRCVQGGVPETTALLKVRWDHIIYTGNGAVGRIVHTAAAKFLTPVTLELGGKSPVYVDKSANLEVAANRIAGTKLFNNGQVCIAPDYVLAHESIAKDLVNLLKDRIVKFVGEKPQASASLARLINTHHFDRIKNLLSNHGGEVVIGGLNTADRNDRFIPPTIILNPNPNSSLMQEEIFGPLLPILVVRDEKEAVNFINSRESPLALYVFAENHALASTIVDQTLAGGSCINDCIFHISNPDLPFGGVGTAGIGAYHGKAGFDEFSHRRSVMFRSTWLDPSNRYMPYKKDDVAVFKKIIIGPIIPPMAKNMLMAGGAAAVGYTFIRSML